MAEFWDSEYESSLSEPFDWFFEFDDLALDWWQEHVVGQAVEILVVGCGHSTLSKRLSKEFPTTRVISIDSSQTCIDRMREQEPELEWYCADAGRLDLLPETFGATARYDLIIDKGMLDAVLGYGTTKHVAPCVSELKRVLKDDGRVIIFACTRDQDSGKNFDGFQGGEASCVRYFKQDHWDLETFEIPAPSDRGLSPAFDDVRPTSYALVKARKKPPWTDYATYYSDDDVVPHEAFLSWDVLGPVITPYLSESARVLEVGCGNSAVGAEIATKVAQYVGVDVVPTAVLQQRKRYPDLDLRIADARHLQACLFDLTFDVVFDKGTADALFLYDDVQSSKQEKNNNHDDSHVHRYLEELEHILPPGGRFIVVACAREDGILSGAKAPRLWTNVAEPRGWTLEANDVLHSDVGAGDRTFDFLVLLTP